MRGCRSSVRFIWRTVLSIGMAETSKASEKTSASATSSETSTYTSDEEKINDFIPENTPSKTPQQEDDTHKGASEDDYDKKKKNTWKWWNWKKADFNKMSIEQKRFYYRCGKNFVTLDKILSWPDYVESNLSYLIDLGLLRKRDKFHTCDENNKINKKVSLWQGDITHLEIDAIVNAANTSLRGGGGVDGCIHRAAGDDLFDECLTLKGCRTGEAKITSGYKLPAKKVIHTVGPIGENKKKLQSCYESCLNLVQEHKLRTVAFCCISTGVYGYPNDEAAIVAVETVKEWLEKNGDDVDRIIFCIFLESDYYIYHQLMLKYFPCTVASGDDDDQGDCSMEKASTKECSKTENKKGDEKRVKKTAGNGVLNKEDQNKADVGSGDHTKVDPVKEETEIKEDVETDALDHPTKSDTAEEQTQNKKDVASSALDHPTKSDAAEEQTQNKKDVASSALDHPTKSDAAEEQTQNKKDVVSSALDHPTKSDATEEQTQNKKDVVSSALDHPTKSDTAKEKAGIEDVGGGDELESAGVELGEESKMHVDRCDSEEDRVDKSAEKVGVDETTESGKEDEGVQINPSKSGGDKVENDGAVHEMKKRKRDGEKMELDVDGSGDGNRMDTDSGEEALPEAETLESDTLESDTLESDTLESDKDG